MEYIANSQLSLLVINPRLCLQKWFPHLIPSCWLSTEYGTTWAYIGPMIAVIAVSCMALACMKTLFWWESTSVHYMQLNCLQVNMIILMMTLYSLLRSKTKAVGKVKEEKREIAWLVWQIIHACSLWEIYWFRFTLKATFVLLPLLGCTWIIGVFAVSTSTTVFLWIFTILNSLQVGTRFLLAWLYTRTAMYFKQIIDMCMCAFVCVHVLV